MDNQEWPLSKVAITPSSRDGLSVHTGMGWVKKTLVGANSSPAVRPLPLGGSPPSVHTISGRLSHVEEGSPASPRRPQRAGQYHASADVAPSLPNGDARFRLGAWPYPTSSAFACLACTLSMPNVARFSYLAAVFGSTRSPYTTQQTHRSPRNPSYTFVSKLPYSPKTRPLLCADLSHGTKAEFGDHWIPCACLFVCRSIVRVFRHPRKHVPMAFISSAHATFGAVEISDFQQQHRISSSATGRQALCLAKLNLGRRHAAPSAAALSTSFCSFPGLKQQKRFSSIWTRCWRIILWSATRSSTQEAVNEEGHLLQVVKPLSPSGAPMLLEYRDDATFVAQFVVLSLVAGIPILTLFMAIGQHCGSGIVDLWTISPLFKGIGISLLLSQVFLGIYSSVPITWMFLYIRDAFIAKWSDCAFKFRQCVPNDVIPPLSPNASAPLVPHRNHADYAQHLDSDVAAYFQWLGMGWLTFEHLSQFEHLIELELLEEPDLLFSVLSNRVLQRNFSVGSFSAEDIHFEGAFNLTMVWLLVAVCLSRGLHSYGKMIPLFSVLPISLFVLFAAQIITLSPKHGVDLYSGAEGLYDFNQVIVVAREVFFIWGWSAPVFLTLCSHLPSKHRLKKDVIVIFLTTMTVLLLGAFAATACLDLLKERGFSLRGSSFEQKLKPPAVWFVSLMKEGLGRGGEGERGLRSPSLRFLSMDPSPSHRSGQPSPRPHVGNLLFGNMLAFPHQANNQSGYVPLRFAIELFPAATGALRGRLSTFWGLLFYLSLALLGIGNLLSIWRTVIEGVIGFCPEKFCKWQTSILIFTVAVGFLFSLPLTSSASLDLFYFLDSVVGAAWWVTMLLALLLFSLLIIRGSPYGPLSISQRISRSPLTRGYLVAHWLLLPNLLLAVGCFSLWDGGFARLVWDGGSRNTHHYAMWEITLRKVSHSYAMWEITLRKVSHSYAMWEIALRKVSHSYSMWEIALRKVSHSYAMWEITLRKVGGWLQVSPLLLVLLVACVQTWRYMRKKDLPLPERFRLLIRSSAPDSSSSSTAPQDAGAEQILPEESPPKYTPPPSYSAATGAAIAAWVRSSVRASVRSVQRLLPSPRTPPPDYTATHFSPLSSPPVPRDTVRVEMEMEPPRKGGELDTEPLTAVQSPKRASLPTPSPPRSSLALMRLARLRHSSHALRDSLKRRALKWTPSAATPTDSPSSSSCALPFQRLSRSEENLHSNLPSMSSIQSTAVYDDRTTLVQHASLTPPPPDEEC
ncbi:unnamed protein product [Cyprideis torosa]|uniref:Uncharacterized protein n=1 Tax=Cyprideis torosa TaxID=163714 RepID=A0A7R8ZJC6_9CRUS|nr:unnamed protein product [Cyprideis torosa]CAG0881973.1 unnamed protein product [Cyprideis torosa]